MSECARGPRGSQEMSVQRNELDREPIIGATATEAKAYKVHPGAFHARQIVLGLVNRFKKPLLALGVTGAVLVAVSGCAGTVDNTTNNDEPVTEISAPVAAECGEGSHGSVLPSELIEDEHGKYCSVEVSAEALEYDAGQVDLASLEAAGFTEADAKVMWEDSMTFVAEEVIDSKFLEREKTPELAEEIWETYLDRIDTNHMTPGERINEAVVTGLPVLVRDGKPRVMNADMYVYEITTKNGNPTAQVRGLITYRVNPDNAKKFLEKELGHEIGAPENHLSYYPDSDTYGVDLNMGYTVAYSKTDDGFKFGGAGWIYEFEVHSFG